MKEHLASSAIHAHLYPTATSLVQSGFEETAQRRLLQSLSGSPLVLDGSDDQVGDVLGDAVGDSGLLVGDRVLGLSVGDRLGA